MLNLFRWIKKIVFKSKCHNVNNLYEYGMVDSIDNDIDKPEEE